MPRRNPQGFNKEKLVFMATACIAACVVYYALVTRPVELADSSPISLNGAPLAMNAPNPDIHPDVRFYVVDGKVSNLTDPKTGQLVNRQRKTPFAPAAGFAQGKNKPGSNVAGVYSPPTPPPPPAADDPKEKQKLAAKKLFEPTEKEAQVAFMGVVTINGQTYGLLKPKDGGPPVRVKAGDSIPDLKYTVEKIDKQAITVVDADKNPFTLRDSDGNDAAIGDKSDEDLDGVPVKEVKKEEKPAAEPAKDAKPPKDAEPKKKDEPKNPHAKPPKDHNRKREPGR